MAQAKSGRVEIANKRVALTPSTWGCTLEYKAPGKIPRWYRSWPHHQTSETDTGTGPRWDWRKWQFHPLGKG